MLDLIATVIECCEPTRAPAPGHPPTQTVRVLATLRQFLREGTPWRSLRASAGQASGSTLRRTFECWARTGLLRKVHVKLTRSHGVLVGLGGYGSATATCMASS